MRDCCALSAHGQPLSCLCFSVNVDAEKNDISNEDYIRLLIFVTLLVILVVFSCHAFARISTYGIHIVCSYFLVWYLYLYFYCVLFCSFCFLSFPLISAVIGFLAVVTAFLELCCFCCHC